MDWASRVQREWQTRKLNPISIRAATDCSGLGSPEIAAHDLELVGCLRSVKLEWAADWSHASQRWLQEVVGIPRSNILGDMTKRSLSGGVMKDISLDGHRFEITKDVGLDLYVCGFPCTPFSTKGQQLGWDDDNSKPFWVAAQTIATLRPKVVVLENVMGIVRSGGLDKVMSVLSVIRGYAVSSFTNLSNHHFGVPQHRPRVYVVMVRCDSVNNHLTDEILHDSVNNFLDKVKQPPVKWSVFLHGLGIPLVRGQTKASVQDLMTRVNACKCGVAHACKNHFCKCSRCAGAGGARGSSRCRWRSLHKEYRKKPAVRAARCKMLKAWRVIKKKPDLKQSPSYFELSASMRLCATDLIKSPRERDLLNALQESQNLLDADSILDLSQTLGRNACRDDGLVPTLGTGCSRMFAPAHSAFLDARQCLALQGQNVSCLPSGFSDDELRTLAGNAMCVPVVGAIMASAFALLAS